jgi:hypothetical protein
MSDQAEIDETLREVRDRIERMHGQLEKLSSAIWHDIEHDDPERLEAGVRFKQSYNERRSALQETMDGMLALLSKYPQAGPGSGVAERKEETVEPAAASAVESSGQSTAEPADQLSVEPIAASPVATGLEQKVPFGFVLGGQTYTSASAWPLFYEALLQELHNRAPEKLSRLADSPGGFQQAERPLFARAPDPLDDPLPIADAIFAEADMAPETMLQVIKRLIEYMGYPLESFKILLKEKNRGTVETLSIAA